MVGKTRVVAAERVRRDPLQDIPLRICPQTRYRVCKKKKKEQLHNCKNSKKPNLIFRDYQRTDHKIFTTIKEEK